MKKALITGGCGFIGSNLAIKLIKQGWEVDVVDNLTSGKLENLDCTKTRVFRTSSGLYSETTDIIAGEKEREENCVYVAISDYTERYIAMLIFEGSYDVIFHMAAKPSVQYSVKYPLMSTKENIVKTMQLLASANLRKTTVIFSSSAAVYGNGEFDPESGYTETSAKLPSNPYAWQKSSIEDYARIAKELYSQQIVSLRYFNVYGQKQHGDSAYSTVVSAWCNAIKNGLPCRFDGTGGQTRDMIHVDDVVAANILVANSKDDLSGKIFNIGTGKSISNKEIMSKLKEITEDTGNKIVFENVPERKGDTKHSLANVEKAREVLGFEAQVSFDDGLEKTLKWWGIL